MPLGFGLSRCAERASESGEVALVRIKGLMDSAYRAFFVTLTAGHRKQYSLTDLFTGLGFARGLSSGKIWDGVRKEYEVDMSEAVT